MFDDADCFGSKFDEFQENFPAVGEFDDAVKAFDFKKILEVIRCINTHLPGHQETFGLGIDIANPDQMNI